jgi:hypothetical protein
VDAGALDAAVGSWLAVLPDLAGQPQEGGRRRRRALAVDGKALRGTRHSSSDGQAVHLLAVIDQRAGAVLAQAAVDGKTNEITRFAPLLEPLDLTGYVVNADAMHTQREHADQGWLGLTFMPGPDGPSPVAETPSTTLRPRRGEDMETLTPRYTAVWLQGWFSPDGEIPT